MKLIVGLGNPGKNYTNTRHNSGFRVIDAYSDKNNLSFKNKFDGLYAETIINNEKVILLKPQTFMNLSGECVLKFKNYYDIDLKDILIIYDDVDFPVGAFKIKRKGSPNGHNGIKNIINLLHSEDISRLKIGISKNQIPLIDYVLSKFTDEENSKLEKMFQTTSMIIEDFCKLSIDDLMQKYNGTKDE